MFKTELCLKVIGKQAYEVIEPLVYDNGLLIVQVNPKFDFDGARFFLCKAVTTTGSYWVFDSVRGIVASTDFGLQLNSTAAETTSADCVDPFVGGISVVEEATCHLNTNGVTYMYWAIA